MISFETDRGDVAGDVLILTVSADGELGAQERGLLGNSASLVEKFLEQETFSGKAGTLAKTATFGADLPPYLVVIGVGDGTDHDGIRRGFAEASRITHKRKAGSVAIALGNLAEDDSSLRAALEGYILGSYRFTECLGTVRSEERAIVDQQVRLLTDLATDEAAQAVETAEAITAGVFLARDLVQMPANALNPQVMAERARQVAEDNDLEIRVLEVPELTEMGAGAITAVGRGSISPPCLIHLIYRPDGEVNGSPVGLVGKCITFDTGGYNIKPLEGMLQMKTDMGGGAAVLGAMSALRALGVRREVHGVICAAENMISHDAFRPGDVLTAMNGVTIEITSTDAEGRLVLADGLVYTSRQGVTEMIDLATLTGAASVALGDTAALFANDDHLADRLLQAAGGVGERLWRLPLEQSYKTRLKGEIADLKNTGGRAGGAIIAALFLEYFSEGLPWAHLDIAGAARSEREHGYLSQGGTGYGVRTLLNYLRPEA